MLLLHRGDGFDANFFYHSGVDIDNSFLLVDGRKKTLFVSRLNESLARACFHGKVVVFDDAFAALSRFIKRKTVFFDDSSLSARAAERLEKVCRLKDYSLTLLRMRAVKSKDELSKTRRAVKYTKEILHSLDLKSAKTELGVKKQLLLSTLELGLEPAFEPIVATDRNSSYPHYSPGNKKLGSLVLVDYGVRYGHYCADLSRCFILDGDRKKKTQYEKLQEVFHSLLDVLPEMQTGQNLALEAEKLMQKACFPKMIHSIGHGIGLDIHELPRLSKKYEDKLNGSTIALEPAFYLEKYGMRYEETVHVGKKATIL